METLLLQIDILWPAFAAGLFILATHVPLGREVLNRGIIFLDLAIAQMAALGVVAASVILSEDQSHITQVFIAVTTAITSSLGLYSLRQLAVKVQEAIIGIVFILAATGSLLLLAADPHGGAIKDTACRANIMVPSQRSYSIRHYLCSHCYNLDDTEKKLGAWLFYPLFAIAITVSTQIVGVYLVFASLIIPSLATLNRHHATVKGLLIGIIGYGGGLVFAAIFDLPAGATIVWCLAITALAYYLISRSLSVNHLKQ